MNQLTIEHLSPYLPHGLKMQGIESNVSHHYGIKNEIYTLSTLILGLNGCLYVSGRRKGNHGVWENAGQEIRKDKQFLLTPVLRPLSDLTKEINHRGETFVPIMRMTSSLQRQVDLFNMPNVLDMKVGDYNQLNSWLFDTQNLIESGLALSVHALEFNPYEK